MLVLYASQTGNAKEISTIFSKDLGAAASKLGQTVVLQSLDEYFKTAGKNFEEELVKQPVVLVVSTTGSGDIPDNGRRFFRAVRKIKELKNLQYMMLGLGDTNYDAFCNAAQKLDQALKKTGASHLLPTALADDATGLEMVVEPWRRKTKEVLLDWATKQQKQETALTKEAGCNVVKAVARGPPVCFLYASQCGNAKEISAMLQTIALATFQNLDTTYSSCTEFARTLKDMSDIKGTGLLVFVVSTTGAGEVPDNGRLFLRKLKKSVSEKGQIMCNVKYAMLGLGDSNYDVFNGGAKKFEQALKKAGASPFVPTALADDGTGLEVVVEPFKIKLMEALSMELQYSDYATESLVPSFDQGAIKSRMQAIFDGSGAKQKAMPTKKRSLTSPLTDKAKTPEDDSSPTKTEGPTTPKLKVPKPVGLARFSKCEVSVVFGSGVEEKGVKTGSSSDDTSEVEMEIDSTAEGSETETASATPKLSTRSTFRRRTYFRERWRNVETEREMYGYTPEAPFMAAVTSARFLTQPEASDRKVLHMELRLPERAKHSVVYHPGDALGIHCPNEQRMVRELLSRLGLAQQAHSDFEIRPASKANSSNKELQNAADKELSSSSPPSSSVSQEVLAPTASVDTPKAKLCAHIGGPLTVSDAFTYCCDITSPPRKAFLRLLAEYCSSAPDKTRLYHLASREGRADFEALMSNRPPLTELLSMFPSCQPPLAHLLQELPPLQPRYYSIACSQSQCPTTIHIALTIVQSNLQTTQPKALSNPPQDNITRKGLCSNWLLSVATEAGFISKTPSQSPSIKFKPCYDSPLQSLSLDPSPLPPPSSSSSVSSSNPESPLAFAAFRSRQPPTIPSCQGCWRDRHGLVSIPVFLRRSNGFCPPDDPSTPLIMIGPGTGVAPFRGFLQQRRCERKAQVTGGVCLGNWRGLDWAEEVTVEEQETTGFLRHSSFTNLVMRNDFHETPLGMTADGAVIHDGRGISILNDNNSTNQSPKSKQASASMKKSNSLPLSFNVDPNSRPTSELIGELAQQAFGSTKGYGESTEGESSGASLQDEDEQEEFDDENDEEAVEPNREGWWSDWRGAAAGNNTKAAGENEYDEYDEENEFDHPSFGERQPSMQASSNSTKLGEVGSCVLFFGCRAPDQDFLYKDDLTAFVSDGTLDSLHTAFSRVDTKTYVQDLMLEQGEQLAEMILKKQANVFVCGDGVNMAKAVQAALVTVLQRFGNMKDKKETIAYFQKMMKERRYVQDVWC